VIVEVAKANPTDGTRMVAALASRELGRPVNRKRVQRVMRAQRLLQPSRSGDRRRRPGFFRVTCPDELWHADMTKVWTAQHGWVYLHAIIDCCTRELVGWSLELRCRDDEAIACVEAAVMDRGVRPGQLTLGTDNGSQPRFPTAASVVLVARRHDPRGQGPRPMTAALATRARQQQALCRRWLLEPVQYTDQEQAPVRWPSASLSGDERVNSEGTVQGSPGDARPRKGGDPTDPGATLQDARTREGGRGRGERVAGLDGGS
jgi:hypothetical protein